MLEPTIKKIVPGNSKDDTGLREHIGHSVAISMSRSDVDALYQELEHAVKQLSNFHLDEDSDHALTGYTLNKGVFENPEDFELTAKKPDGQPVKVLECRDGNVKFAYPIESIWLETFFDVNASKDIIVNHCSSVDAALLLAKIAVEKSTKLVFSPEVLEKLEQKQEGITSQLEDLGIKPRKNKI